MNEHMQDGSPFIESCYRGVPFGWAPLRRYFRTANKNLQPYQNLGYNF